VAVEGSLDQWTEGVGIHKYELKPSSPLHGCGKDTMLDAAMKGWVVGYTFCSSLTHHLLATARLQATVNPVHYPNNIQMDLPIHISQCSPRNCPRPQLDHVAPCQGLIALQWLLGILKQSPSILDTQAPCELIPAAFSISLLATGHHGAQLRDLTFLRRVQLTHSSSPLHTLCHLAEMSTLFPLFPTTLSGLRSLQVFESHGKFSMILSVD
jgi:hypothetical protein